MAKENTNLIEHPDGRYYYKAKAGNGYLNLKSPLTENRDQYEEITKEEFDALTYHEPVAPHEPTAEEIAQNEKRAEIADCKHQLALTDYVVLKLAEALGEGDTETVAAIESDYATVLADRKTWRARINELESELA